MSVKQAPLIATAYSPGGSLCCVCCAMLLPSPVLQMGKTEQGDKGERREWLRARWWGSRPHGLNHKTSLLSWGQFMLPFCCCHFLRSVQTLQTDCIQYTQTKGNEHSLLLPWLSLAALEFFLVLIRYMWVVEPWSPHHAVEHQILDFLCDYNVVSTIAIVHKHVRLFPVSHFFLIFRKMEMLTTLVWSLHFAHMKWWHCTLQIYTIKIICSHQRKRRKYNSLLSLY